MRLGFSRSRGTQDTLGSAYPAFNAAVRAALVAAGSPPPIAARTVVRLQAGDAELVRLKGELRKEFGKLVVAASARVSGKILTFEDQQRLAEETNKQLAA